MCSGLYGVSQVPKVPDLCSVSESMLTTSYLGQVACAATSYISGTTFQGLIVVNNENYVYKNWHGNLIAIAVALFSVLFNTVLARKLPLVEGFVLFIHIFAFIAVLVVLWVLSPITDPKVVFTQFRFVIQITRLNQGRCCMCGCASSIV